MTNFTTAKALSEIRAYAKNLGMTFKRQNATVNGQAAYVLTERKSGKVLLQNFTIWAAYNAMLDGCLDKVARDASLTTPSMEKIMTTVYDLKRLNAIKPTLTLAIYEAAIDWGFKDEEAKQPEQVPYYCELTAVWRDITIGNYVTVSTHGLIYAQADETDPTKFKRWNTSRFEIDAITNSDTYDLENKQDNTQEFEFDCPIVYDNYADISQAAADILEAIAHDLGSHTVNIEYPNGVVELIGLRGA